MPIDNVRIFIHQRLLGYSIVHRFKSDRNQAEILRKQHGSRLARITAAVTLSGTLLLLGCSTTLRADSPNERLMSRFSELWPDSTYMISTVETPQGLWNVYVVSIPPNQVAVRQSRQDGEYEFGMVDDQVWHIAYGKAQPTPLGPEWAWFLRNHELFRFSEWLRTLEFNDRIAKTAKLDSASACDLLRATDRFNLEVVLCITGSGNVEWIEREAPAAYGGGIVRIEIDQWGEYLGRSYLKRYRQIQGDRQFHWEIQAIYEVAPGEAVEPPPGIELD